MNDDEFFYGFMTAIGDTEEKVLKDRCKKRHEGSIQVPGV